MRISDTAEPVRAVIDLAFGEALVIASDRTDTIIEVHPRDHSVPCDVTTAERTRVDYSAGRLSVAAPTTQDCFVRSGAVIVVIELPTGSSVRGQAIAADFRCEGTIGSCRLTTGSGDIRLDRTGPLYATTALGGVSVRQAMGDLEVAASGSDVRIREIGGVATVRKSDGGNVSIGEAHGTISVHADYGGIHIGRAHDAVEARTGEGDLRIDEVVRGPVALEAVVSDVDVGITGDTAVHLDTSTSAGTVYWSLDILDVLDDSRSEETVQVHARTVVGDIVVRRAR
jgi:hypothetical protein